MIIVFSKDKSIAWKAFEICDDDFIISPANVEEMVEFYQKDKRSFLSEMCWLENSDEHFLYPRKRNTEKTKK